MRERPTSGHLKDQHNYLKWGKLDGIGLVPRHPACLATKRKPRTGSTDNSCKSNHESSINSWHRKHHYELQILSSERRQDKKEPGEFAAKPGTATILSYSCCHQGRRQDGGWRRQPSFSDSSQSLDVRGPINPQHSILAASPSSKNKLCSCLDWVYHHQRID